MTLSQKSLRALTTASTSERYSGPDSLILNGDAEDVTKPRTQACLAALKKLRAELEAQDSSLPKLSAWPLKIVSVNNFPTAAGLASSAAGFGALVRAVADLYRLPQAADELSLIARQGSGSACRSLMGGFVAWRSGTKADGTDSRAAEVAPASHWPEMRALIIVASAAKKDVGSTEGMQRTAQTSSFFQERVKIVDEVRMPQMEQAIQEKDFQAFAQITMQDSNSFHACCLDSWPPIQYLNDTSAAVMNAVHTTNQKAGKLICAYTFDAGPNAVIYYLEENAFQVAGIFKALLNQKKGWEGDYGDSIKLNSMGGLEAKTVMQLKSGVDSVICTGIGEGPQKVDTHLIDARGMAVDIDMDSL